MRERFLAILDQEFVEVRIGADDGQIPVALRERDFISSCAKFNVVTEEFRKSGITLLAKMDQPHASWQEATAGQLTACSYHCSHPKLDLMSIQMATDTHVVERHTNIHAVNAFQRYPFVVEGAVPRRSLQGVDKRFRGSEDIIEQSDLAKVGKLSEVKTEKIVLQGFADKI